MKKIIIPFITAAVMCSTVAAAEEYRGTKGDVNHDGAINASDASIVLTAYANISTGRNPGINAEQMTFSDANSDGSVNAVDASLILSYYAHTATGGTMSFPEFILNPPDPLENKLMNMTVHEKVCQMFIAAPEELTLGGAVTAEDDYFVKCFNEYPVGGFIFFNDNIISSEQTYTLLSDIQKTAKKTGIGAFMAVDEEGGLTRVQNRLGTQAVNWMSWYGTQNDYNAAFEAGSTIGSYLKYYGFNVDFAPVCDVNISPTNELGSRIFSSNPKIVSDMSAAVCDGLHSEGICTTLKHFPGLGAGDGNTHYGTVFINRTYEQLCGTEFPAFRGGINAGSEFVMVGHQITAASGDNLPGDLSKTVVTDWLKNELKFRGLAITDSHSMGAITNNYTSGDAAVMAVEAGIDIILMPNDLKAAVGGIESAVESGRLSMDRIDESVLKILKTKERNDLLSIH